MHLLSNWLKFFLPKERLIDQVETIASEDSIAKLKHNIGKLKIAKTMLNNLTIEHYSKLFYQLIIIDMSISKDSIEYLVLSPFFEQINEKETVPFYYPEISPNFEQILWKRL